MLNGFWTLLDQLWPNLAADVVWLAMAYALQHRMAHHHRTMLDRTINRIRNEMTEHARNNKLRALSSRTNPLQRRKNRRSTMGRRKLRRSLSRRR